MACGNFGFMKKETNLTEFEIEILRKLKYGPLLLSEMKTHGHVSKYFTESIKTKHDNYYRAIIDCMDRLVLEKYMKSDTVVFHNGKEIIGSLTLKGYWALWIFIKTGMLIEA